MYRIISKRIQFCGDINSSSSFDDFVLFDPEVSAEYADV